VTIDGRRYADGGAHSLYSADLAAGHDVVTIVSPISLNAYLQRQLDAEVANLADATVNAIIADEPSLAAIGPDPLAVDTMPAAADGGATQAQREALVWDKEP
jgi:NTE family protein